MAGASLAAHIGQIDDPDHLVFPWGYADIGILAAESNGQKTHATGTDVLVGTDQGRPIGWCITVHRPAASTVHEGAAIGSQGQPAFPPDMPSHPIGTAIICRHVKYPVQRRIVNGR